MAQPLYFLPGVTIKRETAGPAKKLILQEAGIGDVFADVRPEDVGFNVLAGRGPGDKSGCIVFYKSPVSDIPRRLGYYPQEQTWTPIDDGSKLWIGLDTAEPPTPADLRRTKVYSGYEIELGDGNKWSIPVIRSPDGATSLPQVQYADKGKLVRTIRAAYRHFWDTTEEIADVFFAGGQMTELRAHELAVQALSINYRFGENEQRILGLVDSENYAAICMCTVDYSRVTYLQDQQKKTNHPTAEESNTSTGLPDVDPTSAPAGANCS